MTTINKTDKLMTITEVAQALRVDPTTVRRWINVGAMAAVELPHLNKRRGLRVKSSVVDAITAGK